MPSADDACAALRSETWREIVERLSGIPADRDEWNEVAVFVEAVRRLAAGKAEELARGAALRRLSDVLAANERELTYLGLQVPPASSLACLGSPEACAEELTRAFRGAAEARSRVCRTFADEQARTADLAAVRRSLECLFDRALRAPGREEPQATATAEDKPQDPGTAEEVIAADCAGRQRPVGAEDEPAVPGEPLPTTSPAAAHGEHADTSQPRDADVSTAPPSVESRIGQGAVPDVHVPPRAEDAALQEAAPGEDDGSERREPVPATKEQGHLSEGRGEPNADALKSPVSGAPAVEPTSRAERIRLAADDGAWCSAVAEQQREWLYKGQNLRAALAGTALEARAGQGIPAWLCWFAALVGDAAAQRVEYDVAEMTAEAFAVAGSDAAESQRFFFAWVCVGLLDGMAPRALQLASALPASLDEFRWVRESPFDLFCIDHALRPARHGRLPQLRTVEDVSALERRRTVVIQNARLKIDPASNYTNGFVKRYWRVLVRQGGRLTNLLDAVTAGTVLDLPTVEALAESNSEWFEVQARYRSHIVNRIGAFLDYVREISHLQQQIRERAEAGANPATVSNEEWPHVIEQGRRLHERLDAERSICTPAYARILRVFTTASQRAQS